MRLEWSRSTRRLGLAALICTVAAVTMASTRMVDVNLWNSTVDGTPIGNSSPSTGRFTTLRAIAAVPSPVPVNGSNMGWNATLGGGETDFVNNRGGGIGPAFNWYSVTASSPNYVPSSPMMSLSTGGGLTLATLNATTSLTSPFASFAVLTASSNTTTAANTQGNYLMWNSSGGGGESDFVNNRGGGGGGFRWYNGSPGNIPGTLMQSIDNTGRLTNSNGFIGPLTGNAATASALDHNPSDCATNVGAAGIDATGAPTCNVWGQLAAATGWTTLPGGIIEEWGQSGSFDTGPVTLTLAHAFPTGCLSATVSDVFQTASRIASYVSCTTTTITVRNNGLGVVSYRIIGH